ncbi:MULTISPECIES: methyltransferase domain-containing protein [Roseomonadaceae]|uniref:Methyltransferase domain-containing protein n=1 Tax=Falsiroseomonas oleicola TaxID=2801474 RepID=A0ABS6HCQ1_9PROT|nr:methyltransferase domain-containing protein [Roseomonas oleicola]MBU8546126.1 methyltransferase domain-containing protein [Roseomonas oleicola]
MFPVAWYDANAARLAADYARVDPSLALNWLLPLLPDPPGLVLDVGAGTGRDAAWLASLGHNVVAAEPAAGMRDQAARQHPHERLQWIDDSLPALMAIGRLGLAFDTILVNAAWQHVAPADRRRAFRKLVGLLRSGGVLAMTLRDGPAEAERAMFPAPLAEVEALARDHGMTMVLTEPASDALGRPEISWTHVAFRLPDDGTGALPLLRHVILNDQKTSTYKLGLLRALSRIADGMAGLARHVDDDRVELPLGLVALTWLRLYLPLVAANLPQMPANRGADGLGFAGDGFRALLGGVIPRLDLRLGARFSGDAAQAVHAALRDAATTITRMPANYMTYPNGGAILPVTRASPRLRGTEVALDASYLWDFGTMEVPRTMWSALGRFSAWIEPAVNAEWVRLMQGYAASQGRRLDEGAIASAMTWSDPTRDVALPRQIATRLLTSGRPVLCSWSGKLLNAERLDIDHCMPWSAWPCSDLWNLLPADRRVNQHLKRDRLPAEALLLASRGRMLEWWEAAYLPQERQLLAERFVEEARASLPSLAGAASLERPEDVFAAVRVQRLRLRRDQQVPEWAGMS